MAATKKDTSVKKMPTQEASVKSTNEKTRKGKGKATVKDTRDLDTCPICMQTFEKVHHDMGDWSANSGFRRTALIMILMNLLSVQNMYNSVINFVVFLMQLYHLISAY